MVPDIAIRFWDNGLGIGGDGSKQESEVLLQLDSGLYSTNSVLVVVQNTFVMPKFINAMISGGEKISRRVLFVFDECHHPFRQVMQHTSNKATLSQPCLDMQPHLSRLMEAK